MKKGVAQVLSKEVGGEKKLGSKGETKLEGRSRHMGNVTMSWRSQLNAL